MAWEGHDGEGCTDPVDPEEWKYARDVEHFARELGREVYRARKLFPSPDGLLAALTEEVGEVAKAMLDEPRDRVTEECVQVAAMALRLALEGDPTLDDVRRKRGATR